MDFKLAPENQQVRQLAREFAETEIKPVVMKYDETQEFPLGIIKKLGDLGFMGVTFPEEYGGAGLSYLGYCTVIEEIARVDPSVALSVAAHNGLCTSHIYNFGCEELKRKYLPDLTSGLKIGAWGLTEPTSGSDSGSLRMTARRDGDYFVLNGTKQFTTHGTVGDIAVVMALTDPSGGKKGISAFVVEKGTKGFYSGKKENKLGMRASDTSTMVFHDAAIPKENLIGLEGEGLKQALKVLDAGRIGIAALAVGVAQGAFDASVKYARERVQFGRPIGEFQAIQWKISEMATKIEAARLLTYKAAFLKDKGKSISLASATAKYYASEVAVKATDDAIQIHGGYGLIKDFPVEKFYRDVKLLTIGEGTSEVQKTVIARNIIKV
ncbi:MAG TPA: acyl-CoA dehydrogenase family protein [Candidatus Acidoferrales bacterium]|nr:acyl-CoA dehydrogenase family protein [Candidatus Acidoferrales bacterium]